MAPTWHVEAQAMKAADPSLTYAEIGRRLGVGAAAVWKACNTERFRESDRQTRARRRDRRRELGSAVLGP